MSNYAYSRQRRPAKREQSTGVNLRYLEEEKRPCDLTIGCSKETSREQRRTSIVKNTVKPKMVTADGAMNMFHLKEYFLSLREG